MWTSGVYRKGAIMKRSKTFFVMFSIMLLFIGVRNLFHFSENVRTVAVVGLAGGGAACAAAIFCFIFGVVGRLRPTEDKKPPDKQPPPPETNRGA